MPKRRIEDDLERLADLRNAPADEQEAALRKALADRVNLIAAKAAALTAAFELRGLIPDLLRAFDRLFQKAAERDPQCWGKNAIAKALKDLEYRDSAPFLRGLAHVQLEAVWAGRQDTAGPLRGVCVLALAACDDLPRAEALRHMIDALADGAPAVRVDALRALAQIGAEEGALLLRLKARLGDREPEVVGQAFESLLTIEEERAVPFVAGFLEGAEEIAEEAALALGASKLRRAADLLREKWPSLPRSPLQGTLLRALAISRQASAIAFLLEIVRTGNEENSKSAAEALETHAPSSDVETCLGQALAARE
jgi:HEAT repeat protein